MTCEEKRRTRREDRLFQAALVVEKFRREGSPIYFPAVREFVGCIARFEDGFPCNLGSWEHPIVLTEGEYVQMHSAFYRTDAGRAEFGRMNAFQQLATVFMSARRM
jgi:hypothetical protein